MMKQFHLRVKDDLYARLVQFAKDDNRTITMVVRMAIEQYLKDK